MNRDWICIALGVAFGELLAYVCRPFVWGTAIALVIVVFLLLKTDKRKYASFALIGIAALCGFARMGAENKIFDDFAPKNEIRVESISFKEGRYTLTGDRTIVYYSPKEYEKWDVKIGNAISFDGDIKPMEGARNPGEFDFSLYYKAHGNLYRCFADSIRITDSGTDAFKQGIYDVRVKLLEKVSEIYISSENGDSGFIRAALLGDRTELNDELKNLYERLKKKYDETENAPKRRLGLRKN